MNRHALSLVAVELVRQASHLAQHHFLSPALPGEYCLSQPSCPVFAIEDQCEKEVCPACPELRIEDHVRPVVGGIGLGSSLVVSLGWLCGCRRVNRGRRGRGRHVEG